jgi:chromosome segregation ATPase
MARITAVEHTLQQIETGQQQQEAKVETGFTVILKALTEQTNVTGQMTAHYQVMTEKLTKIQQDTEVNRQEQQTDRKNLGEVVDAIKQIQTEHEQARKRDDELKQQLQQLRDEQTNLSGNTAKIGAAELAEIVTVVKQVQIEAQEARTRDQDLDTKILSMTKHFDELTASQMTAWTQQLTTNANLGNALESLRNFLGSSAATQNGETASPARKRNKEEQNTMTEATQNL